MHYQPKVVRAQGDWQRAQRRGARALAPSAPRTAVSGRVPAARGAVGPDRRCHRFRADRRDPADRSLAPARASISRAAVNLSPRLVQDLEFPDRLDAHASANSKSRPEQLTLEVTEAASLDDPELVMDIFTRLRVKGVGLSLDDFGTGTSSLTQLYKMPFSEVKIDGTLISRNRDRARRRRPSCARSSTLRTTCRSRACAEGVETSPAFEFLDQIGCDAHAGRLHRLGDAGRGDRELHPRVEWRGSHAGAGGAQVAQAARLGSADGAVASATDRSASLR